MRTPDQVMTTYVALWNATDETERRQLAEEVLAKDAAIIYPTLEAHGRDDVVTALGAFHERFPGARFEKTSGVEEHHGWFRASWHMVLADGSVSSDGEDVAEVTDDGRLCRVIGFHNPLPQRH
jgi:hypothetical protein